MALPDNEASAELPPAVAEWQSRVEKSYAHNSALYAAFGEHATGAEIHAFLLCDAHQPPFYQFLERWRPKAPAAILGALEAHIREEIDQDHSGLFRAMMRELSARFPLPRHAADARVLRELNFTFSPECAADEPFGFFCGSFFATEIMSARRSAQLLKGLRRAGVPEAALEYLRLHAENDVAHAREVAEQFLVPFLAGGGAAPDVERGLADRLSRSEKYLRWYETHGR